MTQGKRTAFRTSSPNKELSPPTFCRPLVRSRGTTLALSPLSTRSGSPTLSSREVRKTETLNFVFSRSLYLRFYISDQNQPLLHTRNLVFPISVRRLSV